MVVSGSNIQYTVTFPSDQTPELLQSFMIQNDDTALETDERYELFLTSPMPFAGVELGESANVSIVDDDSECNCFLSVR